MDFVLVLAYVALPIASWILTRSLTWLALRLVLGFGLAGTAVQTMIALGWGWNQTGLEFLVLGVFLVVFALAVVERDRSGRSLRPQLVVIWLPAVVIGLFLILMRLLATNAGPLTAVGYLFNHPLAEDNAKWLNLTAQLGADTDLVFNGYAGGPLLLIMVLMATAISALSVLLLGGVNEVAVAANAVVGSQFLLIALVPFAFAPFAEKRLPRVGTSTRSLVPAPLVWAGMLIVFTASAVVTSYGHLSLQYVLNVLVLWAAVFLIGSRTRHAQLLITLAIATAASAWLPLNVLGLGVILVLAVWAIRLRRWAALALIAVTLVVTWDSLVSSVLYLLGIDLGIGDSDAAGVGGDSVGSGAGSPLVESATSTILRSPGGTEIVQPLLGGFAILAFLVVAVWFSRVRPVSGWRAVVPFAPIVVMVVYLFAITAADAVLTAASPNYGIHKMAFAVVIMMFAVTAPIALISLDPGATGMTMLRWFGVGGIVLLLSLDTMLPRGLSALSPKLWPAVDASQPQSWSAAEVRDVAEQRIADQPIACVVAPPAALVPTGLPQGQDNYRCARLLTGLTGLEYRAQTLTRWMETDWVTNQPRWEVFAPQLAMDYGDILARRVTLVSPEGVVVGISTVGELLDRYGPSETP